MKLRTANKVIRNAVDRRQEFRRSTLTAAARRMDKNFTHPKYTFAQFCACGIREGRSPTYVRNVLATCLKFAETKSISLSA